ncbi:N-acetylneuraminate synthase [Candidatus Woesearchaeota archaeon]|nr:N-acetylneuraminate synthase [Candidatus Woesearchaeota archaeon]
MGKKTVGDNHPCYIIAEIGSNFNGSLSLAKKLIKLAKKSGADIVKFQTWITEDLCLKNTEKAEYQKEQTGEKGSQFEMIKKLELNYDDFTKLKNYCDKKEIIFMSTPDEEKSAKFLTEKLKVPAIKIGSGELTNISYLKILASLGKPLIVSTGMSDMGEIKKAHKELTRGNQEIIFLHCTTDYPTKLEDVNLNAMLTIKKEIGTLVGYSDHTEGIMVPLVAAALGATIIEKHFTYDRMANGPDHKASLSPSQLKEMIQEIRKLETLSNEKRLIKVKNKIGEKLFNLIAGSYEKKPTERERENKSIIQKSIVIKNNLQSGTVLEKKDIIMKRANTKGITSDRYKEVIGKKLKKEMKKNELLSFEALE